MIGEFWNVRGLNKAGRLKCISDFVADNKLDFVGFQETKMEKFEESFLRAINPNFSRHWLPAVGTAGGVLVGLKENAVEIIGWQNMSFSISVVIRNKCDKLVWTLVVVYGSAYDEGKQEFTDEFHSLFDNWDGPILIGDDFNVVRFRAEKSNGVIDHRWSDGFNDY
jgi:exonuclease III